MRDMKRCTAEYRGYRCSLDAGHDVEYPGDYSNPSWIEPRVEATPHRAIIEWEDENDD